MAERETVAFRVNSSTKEEWQQYAQENPQTENLSQLVRLAVRREINGDHDTQETVQAPQMDKVRDSMSELLEGFGRIEDRISGVESRLNALERESESEGAKYDLQQAVFAVLPTPPSDMPDDAEEWRSFSYTEVEEYGETAEEIAGKLGADTDDVAEALHRLADQTSQVRRWDWDDGEEPLYFKRE